MKQVFLITIIASFCMDSFSQSNVQIGALGVFSKTKGVGLEIIDNIRAAKNLSIGFGTRPIKFEGYKNLYIPVFGTFKYYYPLAKWKLFASVDPGYGIYSSEHLPYISQDYYRNSAIYLSGGIGITRASPLAPYASIHFTKFGFTEHFGPSSQYRPISTLNFSAGIMFNRATTAFTQIVKPVTVPGKDEYYRKSKRQRNVGRVLLGTGIGLIAGSIVVASNSDDAIAKGLSLLFIGGTGTISSLVSIPFFISSKNNKRKMINYP